MRAREVFEGSNGKVTIAYYLELAKRGLVGVVALNLFRAQKASTRAKVYRGGLRGHGSFKGMAYDKKSWSMGVLCDTLAAHGAGLGIRYGWKKDPNLVFGMDPSYVLYIDLPQGQVSFHSPSRGSGPDYEGDWDGEHKSEERILQFTDEVWAMPAAVAA